MNGYPTIEYMKVDIPLAYLWLRHIHGVNLAERCAKSLIADRNPNFNMHQKEYENVPLEPINGKVPKAYYICVGHESFIWKYNYHLAFRYKKGAVIEDERLGVKVLIRDAERIHFSKDDIDVELAAKYGVHNKKAFLNCRNYQFAHWFNKNMADEPEQEEQLSLF